MTRGAAAVMKLLCIEWLQGNVGEAVAENASSVLEAKGKTLVCMSMCASAPAAYERLCECFSLPLLKVIYVCMCFILEAGYVASIRVVAAGGRV